MAYQKFLRETRNYPAAEIILLKATQDIPSEKIHMQAVQLKREIGDKDGALILLEEGLIKYKGAYKLWLIKA